MIGREIAGYVVSFVLAEASVPAAREPKVVQVTVSGENFLFGVEAAVDLALSTPGMLPVRVAVTVPERAGGGVAC